MSMNHWRSRLTRIVLAAFVLSSAHVSLANTAEEDQTWTGGLRAAYFGDRPITQSDEVISLEAPKRAENAAIVPIAINAHIPQTKDKYIKSIYVFVDTNPGPLAGKFDFTTLSGRANLAFRLRVNSYSPLRAVAEMNDGQLHMTRRFVKASGGCSAPASSDMDAALARLGKMKLKSSPVEDGGASLVKLMVSHPNSSGMQMDQVTRLYSPAHFVQKVEVTFEEELVFSAETSFAISENPNFQFYFVPKKQGELSAKVTDTKDLTFTQTYHIATDHTQLANSAVP